jgi:biopolymer transport protein ExbD
MGSATVRPSVNITPLIDVLLVLLIIMMVVTPKHERKFNAQVPDKQPPATIKTAELSLVVQVTRTGELKLNTQTVSRRELLAILSKTLGERPQELRTVWISAASELNYEIVTDAIDVIKTAGAKPIGLRIDQS